MGIVDIPGLREVCLQVIELCGRCIGSQLAIANVAVDLLCQPVSGRAAQAMLADALAGESPTTASTEAAGA